MRENFARRSLHVFATKRTLLSETVPPHDSIARVDVLRLEKFLEKSRRLFVITGAGVSTESGLKDYRSEQVGIFASTNHRPTIYADFLKSAEVRKRYWARNATAWPNFKSFRPNVCHRYLATLEHKERLHWLVTQNVDNLHHKAGSRRLTELHGTVFSVICLACGDMRSRNDVQEQIHELNPGWSAMPQGFAPDADVFIKEEAVKSFRTPHCIRCGGILKPDVVFFGGSVPRRRVEDITQRLHEADALMVAGSSVETYSALRYIKQAKEWGLPVLVLNIGKTRADPLADVIVRSRIGDAFTRLMDSDRISQV